MGKRCIMLPLLVSLAGCTDPLAGVGRLSQINAIPDTSTVTVVATEAELNRDTPILAGILRGTEPQGDTPDVPVIDTGEAGPGDVLELTDDIAEAVEAVPDTQGFNAANQPKPERAKGILGWLRHAAAPTAATASASAAEPAALTRDTDSVSDQSNSVAARTAASPSAPGQQKGLRALFAPSPSAFGGMAVQDVTRGTMLPFGQVARVCDARGRKLGKLVEQAARKGANYKLYDTAPNSAVPRTFYVTGFTDYCPRQFTAALAMFGTPAMHEQLRYGLPASEYPYSSTDKAYEKIKLQVCKVGRSKPCGTRVSRLTQTTTFVSTYENFTGNGRWADILLHEGAVLAAALKTP